MNRIFISDNITPQFNYSTHASFYRFFDDIEEDYNRLAYYDAIMYFGNDYGEGEEYQLGIL